MNRLWSFLEAGGPVVVILLVLSIVATTLSLLKIWQFVAGGVGRHGNISLATGAFSQGRSEEALTVLQAKSSPTARVLRQAITNRTVFGRNIDAAREDATRIAQEELRDLRRYLRGIEVIAQSAPLLGLLGTVVGMIQAFSELEAAGSAVDPGRLAGGIWTALLATALGLAIAIVFSIIGAWLEGQVENERSVIETTLSGYFAQAVRVLA
jgi:biopolymer transport protein ExbB